MLSEILQKTKVIANVGATHCFPDDHVGFYLFGLVATGICGVWITWSLGEERGGSGSRDMC